MAIAALAATVGFAAEPTPADDALALTVEEQAWISEHPVIRLMPDPLFPPYEYFDEEFRYRGIGADFIAMLEQKLGLRFNVIRVKDWQESVAQTKNRNNDVWSVVAKTPERSQYMLFTKPYIESPAVIVVRSDVERRLEVSDLRGLKVMVSSGYAVHEHLKTAYPDLLLETVPDPLTGLKKVSFGMADAMVVNIALASHLMEKSGIANLRMAGEVGYTYRWGFASRSDWPELHSILEKGIARISNDERRTIIRKWVALREQPWRPTTTQVFSLLGVLALLMVAGVLVWNRALKHQITLRTREVEAELAERKIAEAALQESERLLSTAIETISDGFVLTDADGSIILFNRKFQNLYPNSFDLIAKGAKFEEFLRGGAERGEFPEAIGNIEAWVKARMAERDQRFFVVEMSLAGDRWVRAASQKLPSGGRVGIHVDYTELKQAESELQAQRDELEKLNDQKNKFLSIIAHDLKGPFTALMGASDLMLNLVGEVSPEDLAELAGSTNRSAKRVFELLENLLEWSRLQMDGVEFQPAALELKPLAQSCVDLMSPIASEKDIRITNKVPDVAALADANMVDTIIRNLMNNALKFTERAGEITIGAKPVDDWIEVSVADNGVGMPADKVERLFRLDQKTSTLGTDGETGTGLGLHLCKELVEKHGGEIRVESVEGEGSTFHFTLPRSS